MSMMNKFTLRPIAFCLALLGAMAVVAQTRMDTRARDSRRSGPAATLRRAPQAQLKHNNSGGLVSRGGGYCAASASGSADFDLDERIVNVTFSNINNSSANAAPVAPAYTLYPTPVGNVTAGTSYTLSVDVNTTTLTTGWSETQVLAWIDYNQDFDFDDAGEQVFVSTIDALDIYSGSVTIPAGATIGNTRMRIRMHDTHDGSAYINVFNDTPCGDASYGEIEDYVLNISSGGGSAPVNDNCATATSIGVNATCIATNGTTQDATQSQAPATCSTFLATAANDVWYSFVATDVSTTISVTGAGDATTGMDPILEAFSGACGALTSLGCVDATLRGGTESLTIATVPGTTYRYRVYYWTYATAQTVFGFTTCVTAGGGGSTPPNDDCTGAVAVNIAVPGTNTFSGDNTGATEDGATGFVIVWEAFTIATCANVDINYCVPGSVFDDFLVNLSVGCPDFLTGILTGTVSSDNCTLSFAELAAGTYYIPVLVDAATTPVGSYSVQVTTTSCGGGSTPANDECSAVTPVGLSIPGNVQFNGDNTGATDSEGLGVASVWHSFTTTDCANITISYCATTPAFENAFLNLFIGCPFTDFVPAASFETTSCGNDNVTIQYTNVPAGTYYYAVLTDVGATGPYAIDVAAAPCAPPSDYCEASAVALQFEKIGNVTFAGINNNSSSNAGYEDFTLGTPATVVAGASYPLSVTVTGGYDTDQVLAWVDWDHNSVFDAGEIIFSSAPGVGPFNGNVTVPLTATAGQTRMRVRLHDTYVGVDYDNTPNPTPCDTSSFGQVEDYTVDMIGIITGAGSVEATTIGVQPNPSNGSFIVRTGHLEGSVRFDVIDALGRTAYSEQRTISKASMVPFDLEGRLASGSYVLRLIHPEQTVEQRIVVR